MAFGRGMLSWLSRLKFHIKESLTCREVRSNFVYFLEVLAWLGLAKSVRYQPREKQPHSQCKSLLFADCCLGMNRPRWLTCWAIKPGRLHRDRLKLHNQTKSSITIVLINSHLPIQLREFHQLFSLKTFEKKKVPLNSEVNKARALHISHAS
jgi:hypothetical protein